MSALGKISFITWYPSCRRSDALAKELGGTSHLIHYFAFKQPSIAPLKYVIQTITTWRELWRDKAELVLVASPPVFAGLAVWMYCRLSGCHYVVDAHTGVFDDSRWTWLSRLSRFLSRGAAATIVTNSFLKTIVEDWGCRAVVIGDVPVEFPDVTLMDLGAGSHIAVINTFSQDEPLDEILLAARQLSDIQFHITGNLRHSRSQWSESCPSNAHFTGWLSEEHYAALLSSVDVVMCLTTHDHTMQRGAYEAMALEKPLITSDWNLLRETFHDGTIHVDNTAAAIGAAVGRALANKDDMSIAMRRLGQERLSVFQRNLKHLRGIVTLPEDMN
jgi:glycosyltransferase involved in cell wall biosynthesis